MRSLTSPAGRRALRSFLKQRPLLAIDFDGTLVSFRSHPNLVRLPRHTATLLRRLSQIIPVVVISGRSRTDLRTYISDTSIRLIGNHGLEKKRSSSLVRALRLEHRQNLHRAKDVLRNREEFSSCWIEDKDYSFTVHCSRQARCKKLLPLLRKALRQMPSPPRFFEGRRSINALPTRAPHKGKALKKLLKRTKSSCAIFIGDDTTDEDVFAMHDPKIFSIVVGKNPSQAEYFVPSQRNVDAFLRSLLRELTKA
ncbi:MAG: trehalose-phosphatase [Candidatus Peregrinibacteria bacterium]